MYNFKTIFKLEQPVKITALGLVGRVAVISVNKEGIEYLVRYFVYSKQIECWLKSYDLEEIASPI